MAFGDASVALAYFFHSTGHNISDDGRIALLSDANDSADCLVFDSWVPLWFEYVDSRSNGKVQPGKAESVSVSFCSTHVSF